MNSANVVISEQRLKNAASPTRVHAIQSVPTPLSFPRSMPLGDIDANTDGKLDGPTMASPVVCFRIDSMSILVTFNAR
jgi:hypothetical protein